MIAHLSGKILKKTDKGLILQVNQIGYFLHLTKETIFSLNENQEVEFFTHNQIREDASDLYGFAKYQDLLFFKKLISISGIGPKVGMEILNIDSNKIKIAILNEDLDCIKKIPGIGPKTAKRIILELKGSIEDIDLENQSKSLPEQKINEDVLDALTKLGYSRHQISKSLKEIPEKIKSAEEIITHFLKNA